MRFYPFMLRVLATSAAVLGIMLVYTGTVQAQDVQPVKIPVPATLTGDTAVNWSAYPYPIDNTELSPGGYPIFLIECNQGVCYGPTGENIGDERIVATQLPAIKAIDARQPTYHCTYICVDQDQNVVGANPLPYHPPQ